MRASVVLSVLVIMAGCGGSHPTTAEGVVHAFARAVAAHDGEAACALMTGYGQHELARGPDLRQRGGGCAKAAQGLAAGGQAALWKAMARGNVHVDPGAGLDTGRFTVSFSLHGRSLQYTGLLQPGSSLSGGPKLGAAPKPH